METEEQWGEPRRIYWLEMDPPGATVSLFSLFLPIPLTLHLPPFWSSPESCHYLFGRCGKRRRKRGAAHFWCHLRLPQSNSIHPTLRWSAELCLVLLSCNCIEQDEPSCSSDSSQAFISTWEAVLLIPALLINNIPITHQSHLKKPLVLPLPLWCFPFIIPFLCSGEPAVWISWLTPLLHQDQNELLGGREVGLHNLRKGCLSIASSRHSCVVMGAHERQTSCSLFFLMFKGCILAFGSFGRCPIAAKSMQGSSYFQTDMKQSLYLSTRWRDPGLVNAAST